MAQDFNQGQEAKHPDIFNYLDFREYLRDTIDFRRAHAAFSNRTFSRRVGFNSASFLRMVLQGKRNIRLESALRIAEGLNLNEEERQFFENLVRFGQARDETTKEKHFLEITKYRKLHSVSHAPAEQYESIADWYSLAILEGLGTRWREKSTSQMAECLGIAESDVLDSLQLLEKLKLIEKDELGYRRKHPRLAAPVELKNGKAKLFHKQVSERAIEALSKVDAEFRDFGSITLALSDEKFQEVRARLIQIRKELSALYSQDANPKRVWQVNLQLFPLFNIEDQS